MDITVWLAQVIFWIIVLWHCIILSFPIMLHKLPICIDWSGIVDVVIVSSNNIADSFRISTSSSPLFYEISVSPVLPLAPFECSTSSFSFCSCCIRRCRIYIDCIGVIVTLSLFLSLTSILFPSKTWPDDGLSFHFFPQIL